MSTIPSYPVPPALDGSELIAGFKNGQQVAIPPALLNPGGAGTPGLTAYQLWLQAGHTGTLADFLASLKGNLSAADLAALLNAAFTILAATLPDIAKGAAPPASGLYFNAGVLCLATSS